MTKLFFAIIVVLFALPLTANAAAIGVSPKSFSIDRTNFDTTEADLYIHNTGDTPAIYSISADEWPQLISVEPPKFRLEPEESRHLIVKFGSLPVGDHAIFLSIVGTDVGAVVGSPKTGVKIPINMHIEGADDYYGSNIMALIIGLLLLALTALLLSLARFHNNSTWRKMTEVVRHTTAQRSTWSLFKHYVRYHSLAIISLVAIILAAVLLVFSFITTSPSLNLSHDRIQLATEPLSVTIRTGEEDKIFLIRPEIKLSAFTALQKISEDNDLSLSFDPPNEMGVFVTEIAGFENGVDGKYWVYEVNSEQIPIAADKFQLRLGDQLVWKYIRINELTD